MEVWKFYLTREILHTFLDFRHLYRVSSIGFIPARIDGFYLEVGMGINGNRGGNTNIILAPPELRPQCFGYFLFSSLLLPWGPQVDHGGFKPPRLHLTTTMCVKASREKKYSPEEENHERIAVISDTRAL